MKVAAKRFSKYVLLVGFSLIVVSAGQTQDRTAPTWKPRLFLQASGGVWSPGGVDKDRYLASLGGDLSAVYWFNWNTQLILTGSYAKLNTERFYWRPESLEDSLTLDLWEVKGSLWAISAGIRWLFPADRMNYLYLDLGADYIKFGGVEGHWESYGVGSPITGDLIDHRNPDYAFGGHIAPGMFFLFYPQVSMDVAIKFRILYDTEDVFYWLQPTFSVGTSSSPLFQFKRYVRDIGIKIGLNLASLSSDEPGFSEGKESLVGLCSGIFFSLGSDSNFAVQPEVLYSRKGSKWTLKLNDQDIIQQIKLDYIEIPVLANFSISTNSAITPNFYFGPSISFLIKSSQDISDAQGTTNISTVVENVNKTDWGLIVGGGIQFRNNLLEGFSIEARYTLGMSNVSKSNYSILKNGVFSILGGMTF